MAKVNTQFDFFLQWHEQAENKLLRDHYNPASMTSTSTQNRFLFPAIDLREGRVVRLTRGVYDQQTTYDMTPIQQAIAFERAGATWLHMVDLDGARTGDLTHLDTIRNICRKTNLKVEVGGGVRSESMIDQLLSAGVTRVVVGTAALNNWDWLAQIVKREDYADRIVLGLDAKNGYAATAGWEQTSELRALDIAKRVNGWPLAAIVYTDIATDGTLQGPNVEATAEIIQATDVPIVASGGVGILDHLHELRKLNIQGAIIGKALYENQFTINEALEAFEGDR